MSSFSLSDPRKKLIEWLFVLVLIASLLFSFSTGASGLKPWDLLYIDDSLLESIFWQIRFPRVLVAALCGGALAVAGVVSQGLFRNALAGPSIIGTTSGANFLVVGLIFFGYASEHWLLQPVLSFIGAIGSTLLVIKIARIELFGATNRLLLFGFALNALFASLTSFLLSLSLDEYDTSQNIVYWLLGGCNGKGWNHFLMGLPWIVVGIYVAFRLSAKLDVLNLGEDIAHSLSVNMNRLRQQSIICIGLLVGAAVAMCGSISFIGLVVPHVCRLLLGAGHRSLTRVSFLCGMSLMILADTAARTLWAPQEVQVGALIALLGAPAFIFLLTYNQKPEATQR